MAEHPYDAGGGDIVNNGLLAVELDRFYGEDYVSIELGHGGSFAHLTAEQARAVARDLIEHADRLDPPKVRITVYDAPPREPDGGFSPGEVAAAYERGRRQGRHEAGG